MVLNPSSADLRSAAEMLADSAAVVAPANDSVNVPPRSAALADVVTVLHYNTIQGKVRKAK